MAARSASQASLEPETSTTGLAKPLHLQRVEQAVRLDSFLSFVQKKFESAVSGDDSSDLSDADACGGSKNFEILSSRQERRSDRMKLYNFNKLKKSRKWIKNILLSDSSDSDDDDDDGNDSDDSGTVDIHRLLRTHKLKSSAARQLTLKPELFQYQYLSSGLLSNQDKFHEHQKQILGHKKKLKDKKADKKKNKSKKRKMDKDEEHMLSEQEAALIQEAIKLEETRNLTISDPFYEQMSSNAPTQRHTSKSKKKAQSPAALEAAMNAKRRRLWVALCKKEVGRAQKQMIASHKEVLTNAKRLSVSCQRECRKGALLSQKLVKDQPSRSRRLTKEMLLYWKRYEKVEKEHRKRAEKEAQEQMRMDIELREAKRQQRKLNFLITQTELYAHFMSRKLKGGSDVKDVRQEQILGQLDELDVKPILNDDKSRILDPSSTSMLDDGYDFEAAKAQALRNAEHAFTTQQEKTNVFGTKSDLNESLRLTDPSLGTDEELPQPALFQGKLKSYQLKGMSWLNNLYDKGINGILADEMGLGKTVQTIAFLALLAELQSIWGPFLVVAPASTLHNWQQELSRFVPKFKVLPYWGNTSDRKTLRKFWNHKEELHSENSPYHVLVTSYQLVVQDIKYFQRIKWQYMVLDEAQAIKSTSSVRWKLLLGFNCRNRLLLTGTPIQNSMAELWALLHFIMPTLFDSHDEFNEWFSKDIENHAENKSGIDEKHLSRLHMILKPFMLRRIKKDVENELSDKIEILVSCQLTRRQLCLYRNLRSKISIDDLLQTSTISAASSTSQAQSATSSLMNLVMQFRKVCNHPDLFERREVLSPFHMFLPAYQMSRLCFQQLELHNGMGEREKLIHSTLNVFHPDNIYRSIFERKSEEKTGTFHNDCTFSFLRFVNISPAEYSGAVLSGFVARWLITYLMQLVAYRIRHASVWEIPTGQRHLLLISCGKTSSPELLASPQGPLNGQLVFVEATAENLVYTFQKHVHHRMEETVEHRAMRQKMLIVPVQTAQPAAASGGVTPLSTPTVTAPVIAPPLPEVKSIVFKKSKTVFDCQPTTLPRFLMNTYSKVTASRIQLYSSDPAIRWFSNPSRYWLRNCSQIGEIIQKGPEEFLRPSRKMFYSPALGGVEAVDPPMGWKRIIIPDKESLVTDSGKLRVLDVLLNRMKTEGHRVLIYSQMTRMIDILEEYMLHRKHTYIRLDGSSKISDRRDMVADFQSRSDIFVFLLSTRAGGLGINLTAADTVIFYDSDWNPTVDQQAMDRAHRLGQTKQVTVYRLICKGSIEERILQRAHEKSEIQRMVISGGNFKPDTLKPKEVVSLLLDDDELERKFNQRQEERKTNIVEEPGVKDRKRKREKNLDKKKNLVKKKKPEENIVIVHTPPVTTPVTAPPSIQSMDAESANSNDSMPPSPFSENSASSSLMIPDDDSSNDSALVVDEGSAKVSPIPVPFFSLTGAGWSTLDGPLGATSSLSGSSSYSLQSTMKRGIGRSRGRPRGSARRTSSSNGSRAPRTSTLTTAAAELAGAQAGKSAAFAAYGYALPSASSAATASSPSTSTHHLPTTSLSGKGGVRIGRGSTRGFRPIGQKQSPATSRVSAESTGKPANQYFSHELNKS